MKSTLRIGLLGVFMGTIVLMGMFPMTGFTEVPRMINYQGMLTDPDGVPLTGTFTMRFYLYDALSGGNQLWNPPDGEEQSVSVTEGLYNVQLGSTVPLTDAVFSGDTVYLEVVVHNQETSTWETLSPRQRVTSVAYALEAGDADTLGGLDSTALDQSGHLTRTDNPHQVTAAQVGASTPEDLDSHSALESAHHTKTTSFSELTDQATDAQIPNNITIDYAATAGNADTVDNLHANSISQVGHTHSGPEITSKVGDADKLDGLDSTAFSTTGHNHDAAYVNVAGDSMGGPLSVPSLQIDGTTAFAADSQLNTFIGHHAGYNNTSGYRNCFVGNEAGFSNIGGHHNTFLGRATGLLNTNGSSNTFVGTDAGRGNTEGNSNTFIGFAAGTKNTEGNYNIFIGNGAGYNNDGSGNVFIGNNAGVNNRDGNSNIFIGRQAGIYETGSNKLYIDNSDTNDPLIYGEFDNDLLKINGTLSVTSDVTTTGDINTNGVLKMNGMTVLKIDSANYNAFLGDNSGQNITTGNFNTFIGSLAGFSNQTGEGNVFIGPRAGYLNQIGSDNIFIGSHAGYSETGSNKLCIDNGITTDPLIYGEFDNDLLKINGNLGIGTIPSNGRLHIRGNGFPESFAYFDTQAVDQDTGIRFYENGAHKGGIYHNSSSGAVDLYSIDGTTWRRLVLKSDGNVGIGTQTPSQRLDVNGSARFRYVGSGGYNRPLNLTSDGTLTTATSDGRLKTNIENIEDGLEIIEALQGVRFNWKKDPSGKPMIGLIAQEAEKVIPELTFTNPTDGYMGINYAELTAVLIEAVKEQQQAIDQLGVRLGELEKRNTAEIASLKAQVTRLQTMIEIAIAQKVDGQEDGGKLAQNISR